MAMTIFDKLVQRIGDKKIKKYFTVDKAVGVTYTGITVENQTTQSADQLYVSADKHHFYFGDGTSQEVIGDFRVSGLLADRLEAMISAGIRELSKRTPFYSEAIQTISSATEFNFPADCIRIKSVELNDVELYEKKLVYEGIDVKVISNFRIDLINRKIKFVEPTSGSLAVTYFAIPIEAELNEEYQEAVLNYATAMALRDIAIQIKREKSIAMDGIPSIEDKAVDFENESDRYMDRFESVAQKPYCSWSVL